MNLKRKVTTVRSILENIRYERYNQENLPPHINFPKFSGIFSTIETLIKTDASISRFGDGEFNLIFGKSLKFQKNSEELRRRLLQIIKDNKSSGLLIGIPNFFYSLSKFENRSKRYIRRYLLVNRKRINALLNTSKHYHDAAVSQYYAFRIGKDELLSVAKIS